MLLCREQDVKDAGTEQRARVGECEHGKQGGVSQSYPALSGLQPRRNSSEVALSVDMGHVHFYLRTKGPGA